MTDARPDDLWRDFPKTAPAFEARFKTEDDCRAYWIKARWGGKPACAKCQSTRVWPIRGGVRYECAECRHQTSLTSGTKAEKREADCVQSCHWSISLSKRWLVGTHALAMRPKHLQAYLDEFAFRYTPPASSRAP